MKRHHGKGKRRRVRAVPGRVAGPTARTAHRPTVVAWTFTSSRGSTRPIADRLPDIDHGAADRDHELRELGVTEDRIYLDHGLTGTNRARPGLDQALAALREGDTLVVPKLDRLARSVPDARDIGDGLSARGIKLSLGGQVYDPTDPMGKMFFNILATFSGIRGRPAADAHP